MNPERRRKSSDEVFIEIKDSEDTRKKYWNLREDLKHRDDYKYGQQGSEGLKDGISIEFNLDEKRDLTEEQKQVILNTLLRETEGEKGNNGKENLDLSNVWKYLMLLLILILGAVALALYSSGC